MDASKPVTRGGTAGGGGADWSVRGFAVLGAGLFALNPLVWTYSTHAEVFALNNLLVCSVNNQFFFCESPPCHDVHAWCVPLTKKYKPVCKYLAVRYMRTVVVVIIH
jgi:hypothetical protein